MAVRIHFAGLVPGRPLTLLAWAAFAGDPAIVSGTTVHYGRELAEVFPRRWRVASTIADCDVVVYPHTFADGPETERVAAAARVADKPCIFIGIDENLPPSRLTYGTLYRSSIFQRRPHERTIPAFIHDVREETARTYPEVLPKESAPKVGFCGFVGTPLSRLAYRLAGAWQKVDGLEIRARVLRALRRSPRVRCEFISRGSYLGAAPLAAFDGKHPLSEERAVFLRNLFECPYNLAVRGKGNHSVRLFEILCAGRIPLFVDTACVLPFEHDIDWKRHMVRVDAADIGRIGDLFADAHASCEEGRFEELQRSNRRLWEDWLRPEPFFAHVLDSVAAGRPAP